MIGQRKILQEANLYIKEIKKGANFNLLLRAQSGMGKTTLGFYMASKIGVDNCFYYIPNNGILSPSFQKHKRIHLIDEVHTLENPVVLYSLLDSGEYTFILMSNESGGLLEPLKNRCIQLIFEQYDREEMMEIIYNNLEYDFNREILEFLLNYVKSPRDIKSLCTRLNIVFKNYFIPRNVSEMEKILNTILNLTNSGLNEHSRVYLEYLKEVERSSLSNIISGTGIDRTTILTEIEPFLLYKKLIKITSRGREIR